MNTVELSFLGVKSMNAQNIIPQVPHHISLATLRTLLIALENDREMYDGETFEYRAATYKAVATDVGLNTESDIRPLTDELVDTYIVTALQHTSRKIIILYIVNTLSRYHHNRSVPVAEITAILEEMDLVK